MVGAVRGAAGLPVDRVHQVDVAGGALADLLHDRDRRAVDRRPRRNICGCSVKPACR